jgi:hypothetical protein
VAWPNERTITATRAAAASSGAPNPPGESHGPRMA